ncbi:aspartate kinase [Alicyclobacillaceae bacterium I2511]|nr:aspartate kinase [Alicyclobacillaceae bacterium I2511]
MRIVQKYGGTSVGSIERIEAVADRVAKTCSAGHQCVVVVSAMGHATDELVQLARGIDPVPEPREMDALLSTGEQVSAALLAMALHKRGWPGRSFTGWQAGIVTEQVHGSARIEDVKTEALRKSLDAGEIPVVTGFQGISGETVTTLGRGGSDTTAVAVAAALHADLCEIYTDVDGVYTTDPRVVANARKLEQISYDEMLEMANLGAQVLHPRAVENAKQFGVNLVVRSSFSNEEGTLVAESAGYEQHEVVTGIAFEREVARIAVLGIPRAQHGLATVFGYLAQRGVNVDVIVQSLVQAETVDVSFTVKEDDTQRTLRVLEELRGQLSYREIVAEQGLAKVSIVGAGMISNPGVAARMFSVLADGEISIKMVSTSEIKVSCIVESQELDRAVQQLHGAFLTENLGESFTQTTSSVAKHAY